MIYFANPTTGTRDAMTARVLGCMQSPLQANRIEPGWVWAMDNGCFSERWSPGRWLSALEKHGEVVADCVFAAVPDRLADLAETDRRWRMWMPVVRELGYRPAYVAQDGCVDPPWDELDVLFMGGSTAWKKGPAAWELAVEARSRGVWVHWGRVNSRKRFAMAALDGDSADGTFLTFGPNKNYLRLLGWLNTLEFGGSGRG